MICIIIEDQPPAQRILKKYIEDMGTLKLGAVFSDALQAIDYLKTEPVDLIFLDIHLPKISGIDFLKMLPNVPNVILTTAFSNYAIESYELNVVDYLLKPFSFGRFVKAVSKVSTRDSINFEVKNDLEEKEIFIKSGFEHVKIVFNDILYIKSDSDYTEIITQKKKYLSSESLRYWIEVLPNSTFCRIHKSYIINIKMITKFTGNMVYLLNNHNVPIGRAYKEGLKKRILK